MLTGNVALITGGSRGIGAACARKLAALGADIAVVYAGNVEKANEVCAACEALGVRARAYQCDVADFDAVKQTVAAVKAELGSVDILVNSAGITRDGLLMRMKDADWDDVIATDLTSVFHLCRAACRPMLKARYGRIINLSSVVASSGNGGQTNYSAAKAGLIGFTRSIARELGSRGVTANCITPGFIDTDMTKNLPEEHRAAMTAQIPLGRLGQTDDVANAACFLASPAAAYVTGAVLPVNGGMYMG